MRCNYLSMSLFQQFVNTTQLHEEDFLTKDRMVRSVGVTPIAAVILVWIAGKCQLISLTNPTMLQSYIPQCTILQQKCAHVSTYFCLCVVRLWWCMVSKPRPVDIYNQTWWRHQMETVSVLLAFCAGNSPVTGEFLTQRPVSRSFDVFFDLRLNKRLSKQSWGWWFETHSRPLWRHCIGGTFSPPTAVAYVLTIPPCMAHPSKHRLAPAKQSNTKPITKSQPGREGSSTCAS